MKKQTVRVFSKVDPETKTRVYSVHECTLDDAGNLEGFVGNPLILDRLSTMMSLSSLNDQLEVALHSPVYDWNTGRPMLETLKQELATMLAKQKPEPPEPTAA